MPAQSKLGFGTLLEIESATPGTYTTIGGVTALKPPGVKAEVLDRTTMASPAKTKQKLGGLKDWGQTTISLNYDPADTAGHGALIAAVGETKKFRIKFPDNQTWTFDAVASAFEPGEVTREGLITASFTADIDGVPTFGTAV